MIGALWIGAVASLGLLASCRAWTLFAGLAFVAWLFFLYRAERRTMTDPSAQADAETTPIEEEVGPKRRRTDYSRRARLREWWNDIGSPIAGCVLVVVALGLFGLAWAFYSNKSATDDAASRSCERSAKFGPFIARDYAARDVLPAELQAEYEDTIPTLAECP